MNYKNSYFKYFAALLNDLGTSSVPRETDLGEGDRFPCGTYRHVLCECAALNEVNTAFGLFCGIMSAVTYAFMVIFNKKAKSITGLENSMWQLLISFLTVAVFVGLKQGFVIRIEPTNYRSAELVKLFNLKEIFLDVCA